MRWLKLAPKLLTPEGMKCCRRNLSLTKGWSLRHCLRSSARRVRQMPDIVVRIKVCQERERGSLSRDSILLRLSQQPARQ
jgi:hypothetical protein